MTCTKAIRAVEIHPGSHQKRWTAVNMENVSAAVNTSMKNGSWPLLWATMCIRCQEETEAEHISSRMVRARFGTTRGGVVGSDDGRICVN